MDGYYVNTALGQSGISNPVKSKIIDLLREISVSGTIEDDIKDRAISILMDLKGD